VLAGLLQEAHLHGIGRLAVALRHHYCSSDACQHTLCCKGEPNQEACILGLHSFLLFEGTEIHTRLLMQPAAVLAALLVSCRCMGQPLPPPRGLLAAGQLLISEQERQKAMLRALSAGSGGLAGINLAAVGLAGARGRPGMAAAQEAKLRCGSSPVWLGLPGVYEEAARISEDSQNMPGSWGWCCQVAVGAQQAPMRQQWVGFSTSAYKPEACRHWKHACNRHTSVLPWRPLLPVGRMRK
jgi:hypothetical protein